MRRSARRVPLLCEEERWVVWILEEEGAALGKDVILRRLGLLRLHHELMLLVERGELRVVNPEARIWEQQFERVEK